MLHSPLLPVHITAGIVGILSGTAAMSFRKGSPRHAQAGKVFVVAMLTLAASGALIAMIKHQVPNVLAGTLTFYLVTTAWLTARRGDGETGVFDWVALLAALAVGAVELTFGSEAVRSPTGLKDGFPPALYFIFASVILLAAAGDIRMLVRGVFSAPNASCGISGACVLGCSSLQALFSWASSKCSPLGCVKRMFFLFRRCCPWHC